MEKYIKQCLLASRLSTLLLLSLLIDCTKLFVEMPSSFRAQSQMYLSYKSHNTAKGLVAIAPIGIMTLISCLYGGIYPT